MPDSKGGEKRVWSARRSSVERSPNDLEAAHEPPGIMGRPHWHAQVEINYIVRGRLDYRMRGYALSLHAGDLCVFWGGMPHRVTDTSADADFIVIHLPLVHFFRLRLPDDLRQRLMQGAAMVIRQGDGSDKPSFLRWTEYMRSADPTQRDHAVDELLLRIERINFESYQLIKASDATVEPAEPIDQQTFRNIQRMCDYIAEHFRDDIDCNDIASAADIHPKYAMSVFRKSTGMTLNEYLSLLRLSYAQALLLRNDCNVLHVAMESGFRSLSAFNSGFRKISGKTPSTFRKDAQARPIDGAQDRPRSGGLRT